MKRRATNENETQSKRQRYNDSDEETNTSLMDQSQTPDIDFEKIADVGIIEKIHLKNFMCHNELEIQFGPNVNFIVGRNSSGKSAVVTALVVGLGGKASVTSRGSKLRSFIKTGKQTAAVEIKLRNHGNDAYKPELYGDSIIVQRKFNADGSSTYRLKSKSGKIVSQKREDLLRVLDQFNIQVENPISILNQETSKNFLNSKSPHDKYKFFLKATQLEQVEESYKHANEQKEITKETITEKQKSLPGLEKEVLKWEQKYKSLTAIDDLRKRIKRLKGELAWAFVNEREKTVQPVEKDARCEEARIPRFTSKVQETQVKFTEVNKRQGELTKRLQSTKEEIHEITPRHNEAKQQLKDEKILMRNAQMAARSQEGTLLNKQKERNSLLERITEIQNSAQHDYEAERRARQAKLTELNEQLNTIKAKEETTDHHLDQIRAGITKYKSDKYKLGDDEQVVRRHMEKLNVQLRTMKAAQGSQLRRFGEYMDTLSKRIDEHARQGGFHQKPVGPLGASFRVKDQKWALAIESCLKALMQTFCCHDHHDEKELARLMSQVCPRHYKVAIITSKFKTQVYNVSSKRAQSDRFPTVFDMIDADHPMVYNILIDQRTVECVLLIEDGQEARTVMDPDRNPPVNAREAFTLKGDQVFSFPTFRYYSSMQDKARYLTSNVEENIANLNVEIRQQQQQQTDIRLQTQQLTGEIQKNITEERRTETSLMKIREKKRQLSAEITDLKTVEEPTHHDVATYKEEVAVLNEQIVKMEEDVRVKQSVKEELAAKLNVMQENFIKIQEEMKNKVEAADAIKEDVGNIISEVEAARNAKNHYDAKLKEQEKKVRDLKNMVTKIQAEVEKDHEKARSIYPDRIKTRRTPNDIDLEMKEINRRIRTQEEEHGNSDMIIQQYKEKKDAYFKIKKEVRQLKLFCDKLDEAVHGRLKRYKEFRRMKATCVRSFFILLLSNRNYRGQIRFNHNEETLDLNVQPASSKEEGWKDLKSLSGGERSFSTVCFILALWDTIESPFRCLDEFDVFMDMVNRRIAMELLLHQAKDQKNTQFIFLSPLDMSNMGITSSMMKIFKMPNPERGQTTLQFGNRDDEEEDT